MERALSAPGKLFLSGEYAVLWGGTARVAAVGPRAGAYVRRRDDREVHLVLAEGRRTGHGTPLGIRWEPNLPSPFQFAARALDQVFRAHGQESLGLELFLEPSFRAPSGSKLGMGGSARACVLASEAARYVLEAQVDSLRLALVSHAQVQEGLGSGADVAAIFAGGLIRYRRYPVEALAKAASSAQYAWELSRAPAVDVWRIPAPPLFLAYAFTGEAASTPSLVAQLEQRLSEAERAAFVSASDQAGELLEEGLRRGDFQSVVEAVEGLQQLLRGAGPLETEPMRQILALAKTFGGVAKMSGAGGGDGCVAFAPDEMARHRLLEALSARGFWAISAGLEPGLRGESEPPASVRGWL